MKRKRNIKVITSEYAMHQCYQIVYSMCDKGKTQTMKAWTKEIKHCFNIYKYVLQIGNNILSDKQVDTSLI